MARVMEIATPLGADVLLFHRMHAHAEISRLFEYEMDLLSTKGDIDLDQILAKNVTVKLELPGRKMRFFNGFVTRFVQSGSHGRYHLYHATVRPWLWFLTRTANCRIFQEMSVPDIIKKVFEAYSVADVKDELTETYAKRNYCVQYRETDFNFVSRLMEDEGIYYYFQHIEGRHTAVLVDSQGGHAPFEGYSEIPYIPLTRTTRLEQEFIHGWNLMREVQSGRYVHDDYDFEKPGVELQVRAKLARKYELADFEVFDYPGTYSTTADGDRYARTRMDEMQYQFQLVSGEGNARGVSVGSLFKLTGHPRDDQNAEHLVLATEYELEYTQYEAMEDEGAKCTCRFTALDSKQQFRPQRTSYKTFVQGPQTAMVVGPAGDEIHTDKYGRVKVQFHWDRDGKHDENSSCWIRVSQTWAGKRWGSVFLPRIGQEVIVDFLEGDPDRPIITGRVYNADSMPPYPLPGEMTKSAIKSYSSKGGEGFNEIRFEDKKGSEQVFVHGEKDIDIRVKNDRREWIGRDRHLVVKRDKREKIERDTHSLVSRDRIEKTSRDHHASVEGKQAIEIKGSHSFSVQGAVAEEFKADHSEQVTGNYYLKGMNVVIEAMVGLTVKVGGNFINLNPAGIQINGVPFVMINSGGSALTGNGGTLVPATAPAEAEIADNADPGSQAPSYKSQRESLPASQQAAANAPSHDPDKDENKQKKHWIEIELVDEDGKPVPGEKYRITLPDGSTLAEGTTDEKGRGRADGIDPGTCKVTFPDLDKDAWKPK